MSQPPRMFIPAMQPQAAAAQTQPQQQPLTGHQYAHGHTAPPADPSVAQMTAAFQAMSTTGPTAAGMGQAQQPIGAVVTPQVAIVPCPPMVMRSTINAVPSTSQILSRAAVPFGIVIRPLAIAAESTPNAEVPLVGYGPSGIVRCRACRTYINPFVQFVDGGRRWRCNLCELTNDVPGEYFSPIVPTTGQRRDIAERPELTHGCVEFVAPSEYSVRAPMPPVFVFVIDASYTSVSSGLFAAAVASVKQWAEAFKGHSRTRVAVVTFDSAVHYYNLKTTRPQMLVVSDLDAASQSVPALPDELLVNLVENRGTLIGLLEKLPQMFASTKNVGAAYGTAVLAAVQVAKHIGGRFVTFLSGLPSGGVGTVAQRSDDVSPSTMSSKAGAAPLTPEKESAMAQPLTDAAGDFYKNLALDCSRYQITVDIVATSAHHMEVATIAQLPQITGGEVIHLPSFDHQRDASHLVRAISSLVTRDISWEAVMRVRCSKGIRATAHYGHFFVRSTDLLALPAVDSSKAFAASLTVSDPQQVPSFVSVQNALLYTSSSGDRRIRVSTLCLPVTANVADVFNSADSEATVALIAKMAADKLSTVKISDAREAVVRKVVDILAAYRSSVTGGSSANSAMSNSLELLLPDTMRNLPLYTLALLKHSALVTAAPDIRPDARANSISALRTMPVEHLVINIHPYLYNVSPGLLPPAGTHPALCALSAASADPKSVLLVNTGDLLVLHLGAEVAPETIFALFGVTTVRDVPNGAVNIPVCENEYNVGVRALVAWLQGTREAAGLVAPRLVVSTDMRMLQPFLVADHTRNFYSYHEFVAQLQRNVQQRFAH